MKKEKADKKLRFVFVIQARQGSKRLPGKTFKMIAGKPMLGWLVDRIKPSKYLDDIVIATSAKKIDDEIVEYCKKEGLNYFRGSENDVLGRVFGAAKKFKADAILRIGPDCPFLDWRIVDEFCKRFLVKKPDYVCSFVVDITFPWGIDLDMFSIKFLEKLNRIVKDPYDREHVSPYPLRHRKKFKVESVRAPGDFSNYRLTVDHPEDLVLTRAVFNHFRDKDFTYIDACKFLDKHPEVKAANSRHIRTLKVHVGDKDMVKENAQKTI